MAVNNFFIFYFFSLKQIFSSVSYTTIDNKNAIKQIYIRNEMVYEFGSVLIASSIDHAINGVAHLTPSSPKKVIQKLSHSNQKQKFITIISVEILNVLNCSKMIQKFWDANHFYKTHENFRMTHLYALQKMIRILKINCNLDSVIEATIFLFDFTSINL